MTNSVVGALIEQVQHRCKFNNQGCKVKMMLKDLAAHEKICPERTIKCPFDNCGTIVKLSNFNDHALNYPRPSSIFSHSPSRIETGAISFYIRESESMNSLVSMHYIEAYSEMFHVRLS